MTTRAAAAFLILVGVAAGIGGDVSAAPGAVDATAGKLNSTAAKLAVTSVSASLSADRVSMTIKLSVNAGSRAREAVGNVELPPGAVITSAEASVQGTVIALSLSDSKVVDSAYDTVRTAASPGRRGGAIKIAESYDGGYSVQALLPEGGKVAITLHVDAATCFWRDARYLAVPALLAKKLPRKSLVGAKFVVTSGLGVACDNPRNFGGIIDDDPLAMIRFADTQLAKRAGGEDRFGTVGSRVVVGTEQVGGAEFAIASTFSEVPANLHTVLVVDGSRSMASDQEELALAVEGYLRAAPNSSAQIVRFDRTAAALTSAFVPSSSLLPRLAKLFEAATRNGSDPGQGIALAGQLLSKVTGVRRVVLFTDALTAKLVAANAAQWTTKLPAGTVLHVVVDDGYLVFGRPSHPMGPAQRALEFNDFTLDRNGYELVRDDHANFASVAIGTGGMAVHLVESLGFDDKKVARIDAMLLARPTSIDNLTFQSSDWNTLAARNSCAFETKRFSLVEGNSCRWVGNSRGASTSITVTGMIWGSAYSRTVELSTSRSVSFARDLGELHYSPSPAFQKAAHIVANAVNASFSLGGTWGGSGGYVGIEDEEIIGSASCGCADRMPGWGVGEGDRPMGPSFEDQVQAAMATCKITNAKVDLTLETTLDEIVAVAAKITKQGASKTSVAADRSCVENAVWDMAPSIPDRPTYKAWTMSWDP